MAGISLPIYVYGLILYGATTDSVKSTDFVTR